MLHRKARDRVEIVEEKNKALTQENKLLQEKLDKLQEELDKKDETVEKLQKLLFERHQPRTRTQRTHEKKLRTPQSYRPTPTITEHKTLSLTTCPDCKGSVSALQSSRTPIIEDIVLTPQPVVTQWTITHHWCASCKKLVEGEVPGVLPHSQLGPNLLTVVLLTRYR